MITTSIKVKTITSCFGDVKMSSSGNNVSVICPACADSDNHTRKKKLSIDVESGVYHCWVCEAKGSNIGKLAMTFKSQTGNANSKYLYELYKKKSKQPEQLCEESELLVAELPTDFKLVYNLKKDKNYKRHFSYLESRGLDEYLMKKHRICVSNQFGFRDKVIFPSFDLSQNLNYFVSRTIIPDEKFKYKNFKGKKKEIIFREVDLDFKKELVLVEGVFDLINCPDNSTCMLGSWIDKNYLLFSKIIENKTPVILCLDPDAYNKSLKIAKSLSEYCIDVRISQHKQRDFGSMTKKEAQYFINTSKHYDNADFIGYLISDICSGSLF